ncbi:hypothetical protein [Sphingomonas sp.]|uniref:hypothetical protein n=1 Tax=Sphingomonas sp. TaxID=28214 RepID=UPI002E0E35A2|nr:hypothetical protein [Sphingomonas sp.]
MRSVASESVQTASVGGRTAPWPATGGASARSLFAPSDGRFAPAQSAGPSRSWPLGGFVPYAGHCIVPVKTNGLVRLPSFVRRNVNSDGPSIFLGLHGSQNCLVGSSVQWWQQLTMNCDGHRFEGAGAAPRRDIPPPPAPSRRLFGFCEEFWRPNEFVKLPSWARAVAGIANAALFVGTGETFEVWSIEDAMKSDDPNLVALVHSATKLQ